MQHTKFMTLVEDHLSGTNLESALSQMNLAVDEKNNLEPYVLRNIRMTLQVAMDMDQASKED